MAKKNPKTQKNDQKFIPTHISPHFFVLGPFLGLRFCPKALALPPRARSPGAPRRRSPRRPVHAGHVDLVKPNGFDNQKKQLERIGN